MKRFTVVSSYESVCTEPSSALSSPETESDVIDAPTALSPMFDVAKRGRLFARRHKRRLMNKDGSSNVTMTNIARRRRRMFSDIFTTMLEWPWYTNVLILFGCFITSWLFFAILWYLIAYLRGDIHRFETRRDDDDWTPCVYELDGWVAAFLFSLESQHTIGYGLRGMSTKCPEAVLTLILQSIVSVIINGICTGIIFAKFVLPKNRAATLSFSKLATVTLQDGAYYLMFRVADTRRDNLVGCTIHACIVQNRLTQEGDLLPLCQARLELSNENELDTALMLPWPQTILHKIDESSPLWEKSSESLLTDRFEIVVFLEGTVESTGMAAQFRTSYLPWEIQWGCRPEALVTYQKDGGKYKIDHSLFHHTVAVSNMPDCSAAEYRQRVGLPPTETRRFACRAITSVATVQGSRTSNGKSDPRSLWSLPPGMLAKRRGGGGELGHGKAASTRKSHSKLKRLRFVSTRTSQVAHDREPEGHVTVPDDDRKRFPSRN